MRDTLQCRLLYLTRVRVRGTVQYYCTVLTSGVRGPDGTPTPTEKKYNGMPSKKGPLMTAHETDMQGLGWLRIQAKSYGVAIRMWIPKEYRPARPPKYSVSTLGRW